MVAAVILDSLCEGGTEGKGGWAEERGDSEREKRGDGETFTVVYTEKRRFSGNPDKFFLGYCWPKLYYELVINYLNLIMIHSPWN